MLDGARLRRVDRIDADERPTAGPGDAANGKLSATGTPPKPSCSAPVKTTRSAICICVEEPVLVYYVYKFVQCR